MNLRMKFAAVAASVMLASGASAAPVDANITSIQAFWENTVPASVTTDNTDPTGTVTARWGDPATADGQSGYDFTAEATPINGISVNSIFDLGTFVHQNFPIFDDGSVPGTLDLRLEIGGTLTDPGATAFAVTSIFSFTHTETPNDGNPCAEGGAQPCPDLVEVVLNSGASTSVNIDGVDYFFSVSGFEVDGTPVSSFLTLESQSNQAILQGTFTADVNVVPLPAAGWMLLAGVGGLAALRRRKKAA